MVNKEEYMRYVKELLKNDYHNEDLICFKKGYKSSTIGVLVSSGFVFALGILFTYTISVLLGVLAFMCSVFMIGFGVVRLFKLNKVTRYYKEKYSDKILDYLFKNSIYSFDFKGEINKSIFNESQFSGHYDDYSGSDMLTINIPNDDGSKSDADLILCDLFVTRTETDSDGDSDTVTVYKGVFGYIDFPFDFNCMLGINVKYKRKGIKMEKINLEDIKFNKKFNVYSNDQIESRYILTPDMMEKIQLLKDKAEELKIVLVGRRMYIGLEGFNMFELDVIEDDKTEKIFEKFYDDVDVILKIVYEIKNNNKIFKM